MSTKAPQQRADPMCDVLANLVWGQVGAGVLVRRRAGKDLLRIACVFCNILFYREQAHEETTVEAAVDNFLSSGEFVDSF